MCMFETEMGSLLPKIWYRYVDDVFAIIKKSQVDEFLKLLNGSKYKSIKFTCEMDENRKLPFLDLLLTRKSDGTIDVSVYRKATATDRFISNESHCPSSHKIASLHSMIYRLVKLTLSVKSFMMEITKIKEIALTFESLVKKHSRKLKLEKLSTFFIHQRPKSIEN